jgi:hypothetical protein
MLSKGHTKLNMFSKCQTKMNMYSKGRDWEEFFVKETMAPYLTTSRGHFRE